MYWIYMCDVCSFPFLLVLYRDDQQHQEVPPYESGPAQPFFLLKGSFSLPVLVVGSESKYYFDFSRSYWNKVELNWISLFARPRCDKTSTFYALVTLFCSRKVRLNGLFGNTIESWWRNSYSSLLINVFIRCVIGNSLFTFWPSSVSLHVGAKALLATHLWRLKVFLNPGFSTDNPPLS